MTHQQPAWPESEPLHRPLLDTRGQQAGSRAPRTVPVATVLTGVWLLLAPSIWSYGDTGGGFDARWNDLAVGLVVLAAGGAQLVRPTRRTAVVLPIVFGFWLAIAPFALAYNLGADPGRATVNDTVAGTLLTGFTVSGYLSARDVNRWEGHVDQPWEAM